MSLPRFFGRPSGTCDVHRLPIPSDESLGYFQPTLRVGTKPALSLGGADWSPKAFRQEQAMQRRLSAPLAASLFARFREWTANTY
jgi:hypothetical protein